MTNDTTHTTTIAIIVNDERVLLLQRNGTWELISAELPAGVTTEIAIHRKVEDATGITGLQLQFVGISIYSEDDNEIHNTIYASFINAEVPVVLTEHQAFEWFPLSAALQMLAGKHHDVLIDIIDQFVL